MGGGVLVVIGMAAVFALATHRSGHPTQPPPPVGREAPPPPTGLAAGSAERRSLAIENPRDLERALTSNGVAPVEAAAAAQAAQAQLGPNPGALHLVLIVSPSGAALRLVSLEARRGDNTGASLSHGAGDAFLVKALAAQLTSGVRVIRSEMDANSFYTSAVAAGVPDTLISPFSNAFTFDFDFQREIKQGDVFEAVFSEQVNERGESAGAQELLYVSMQTAAKSRALYRYKAPGQAKPGWYDGNGRSVVRSFMRTPVEGARVSSTFGMRMHPVLGFMKMHKGIDFAAPIGTPIYAASGGAVEWAAMKGPNGNMVILKHDNGWETYYLHMVQIAGGMAPGVRVQQGQQIGQVGMTGRATGPHLHYEVHINGEAVDPMGIPVEEGSALAGADLKAFLKERDRIDALRQAQSG